jgi:hypothetical protein
MGDELKSDFEELKDKVELMATNLADLNIQQKLSIQSAGLFMTATREYRDKLDKVLTSVIDHQKIMDERCLLRQVNCAKYDEHIKREESSKTFIKDKKFAFLLIVASSIIGAVVSRLGGVIWR